MPPSFPVCKLSNSRLFQTVFVCIVSHMVIVYDVSRHFVLITCDTFGIVARVNQSNYSNIFRYGFSGLYMPNALIEAVVNGSAEESLFSSAKEISPNLQEASCDIRK